MWAAALGLAAGGGLRAADYLRDAHGGLAPCMSCRRFIERGMDFVLHDLDGGWATGNAYTDADGKPVPGYVNYAIADSQHRLGVGHPVNAATVYPAFHHSLFIRAFLAHWRQTGDPACLARARQLADWNLARRTPADWRYGNLFYSTACAGKVGGSVDGDAIMTDKPAMMALAMAELADATADPRYRTAADQVAATLAKTQSPAGNWPFRVNPQTGEVREDYTSAAIYAVMLFEALGRDDGTRWAGPKTRALEWILNSPAKTMLWRGFYEDIPSAHTANRTNWDCIDTARWLVAHRAENPDYLPLAVRLNDWIVQEFADQSPAWAPAIGIREQKSCFHTMGIHTLHWAALQADLHAATGDAAFRARALDACALVTYWMRPDNAIAVGPTWNDETWFSCHLGAVLYMHDILPLAPASAARPAPAELAVRDAWLREHFPAGTPAPPATAEEPAAGLMAWTSLGPVFCNTIPGRAMQVADRTFDHGLFCHAPARVQVRLPGPAASFSAVVGILSNPDSQGGSVVFSVDAGGKRLCSSPVMHRNEPGSPIHVDLGGARDLVLATNCAGDGLASDQGVWGDPRVTLLDGRELFLSDLPLHDPLTAERAADTPPFSFCYGNQHSDRLLPAWTFKEERDASDPRKTVRVRTHSDPQTGLVVRNAVVEYAGFPTVEWTLSFTNTGTADTPLIEGVLPLDSWFTRGEGGEFLLHHFVGSPCQANDYEPLETSLGPGAAQRIHTDGGRPTNSRMPYFNLEAGQAGGVIAVIGWAGQWAAQFTRDDGRGLRVTGGQEATSFRLRPGEEVRSPVAVLQFYQGDWHRAQNVWRAWMLEHNVPRRDGRPLRPFIYGCTGNYYPGLKTDAATELQFLESHAREGILPDYWNQDAGWYPCGEGWWNVGTWEVDRSRWPNGLRQSSDWLHAHQLRQIVWFEPERAAAGTWLTRNHPEWCFGGAGGGLMRIGDAGYRQWITDRIDQLLTSEGIDFYRQDFNLDPLHSWRGSDAEDRQGIEEIRHVEGYRALWDELVRRHPALWIDSCASGGRRNDLETLRRAVPILRSDFAGNPGDPGYDPLSQQNHIYGLSFWMPYHGSGLGHIDPYWTRSLMGPIVGFGIDTRKPGLDYELLRKLQRQVRQVQPCYLGDYWPLTPYSKEGNTWCAYQFDLPDAGHGIIHAFRRKTCPDPSITLMPRGLQPQARYRIEDIDGGEPRELSGRELLEGGLKVTAAAPQTALLLTYRRQP